MERAVTKFKAMLDRKRNKEAPVGDSGKDVDVGLKVEKQAAEIVHCRLAFISMGRTSPKYLPLTLRPIDQYGFFNTTCFS